MWLLSYCGHIVVLMLACFFDALLSRACVPVSACLSPARLAYKGGRHCQLTPPEQLYPAVEESMTASVAYVVVVVLWSHRGLDACLLFRCIAFSRMRACLCMSLAGKTRLQRRSALPVNT